MAEAVQAVLDVAFEDLRVESVQYQCQVMDGEPNWDSAKVAWRALRSGIQTLTSLTGSGTVTGETVTVTGTLAASDTNTVSGTLTVGGSDAGGGHDRRRLRRGHLRWGQRSGHARGVGRGHRGAVAQRPDAPATDDALHIRFHLE